MLPAKKMQLIWEGAVTTDFDQSWVAEFEALEARMDRFFVELNTECPYGLPYMACFYQAMFGPLSDRTMELFLAAGYRRNGNCLYTMHCRHCSACIPIRLRPASFVPNRSQRRVQKKNRDLDISFDRVQMDSENLDLCDRFLQARYPQEHNTAEGYYGSFFCNTIVNSIRIEFRLADRLLGGSIVDIGDNWLNAVYFYFDPAENKRGLGTYNILTLVKMCLDMDIEYLYLGYYIEEVSAMNYKNNFRPHEVLSGKFWQLRK